MTHATKTAERINSMTPMEILEFVENAIIAQGCASVYERDGRTDCAYRGINNTKCAMGVVLDDSDYRRDFEGMRAIDVCDSLGIEDRKKIALLQRLQYAHDNAFREVCDGHDVSFVDSFKSKMFHVRAWLNDGANILDMRGYNVI